MIAIELTADMLELIKNLKNKKLESFECALKKGEAYGNVRINAENISIELLNEEEPTKVYDTEDMSRFTCKLPKDKKFKPYLDEPFGKHIVDEEIMGIDLIKDYITINKGEKSIVYDMALIIKTKSHSYVFARGWFYSEVIFVAIDKTMDEIYPEKQVVEDWSNDGDNIVSVSRKMISL